MVNKNIKLSAAFAADADATRSAGAPLPQSAVAHDTKLPYSTGSKQQPPQAEALKLRQSGASVAETMQQNMLAKLNGQGVTGTLIYGGYFAEEYLGQLKGRGGVLIYDEMRRGDYQVAAVLRNIFSRLKGAKYYFEACEAGDAEGLKQAEFLNYCFFESLPKTFKDTLQDVLGFLTFGFSVFEPTFKVENHADFGTIWTIKSLGWRSQKTIWRWVIKDDKLVSINQISWGDDSVSADIDGADLLVFTNDREGNNFEGISILRGAYGAWFRKQLYHTINGIGIERSSLGVVDIEVAADKIGTEEESIMDAALVGFMSGNTPYLKRPEGWKLTITKNEYDSEAVQKAIRMEDANIAKSVMTEFIELGLTDTGTQALSESKVDNFVKSLVYISDIICDGFKPLAEKLIKFNFGETAKLKAKMRVVGLDEQAGIELAQTFKALVESGLMETDDGNKEHVRKLYKLPERAAEAAVAEAGTGASADAGKDAVPEAQTTDNAAQIAAGMKQEEGEHGRTIQNLIDKMTPDTRPPLKKVIREIVDANIKSNPSEYLSEGCACGHKHAEPAARRQPRAYEKKVNFAELEKRFASSDAAITQTIADSLKVIFAKYKHDLINALKYARNEKEKYSAVAKMRLGYIGKFTSNLEKVIAGAVIAGRDGAYAEIYNGKKQLAEAAGKSTFQLATPKTTDLPAGVYGWIKANAYIIAEAQQSGFKNKLTLAALKSLDNARSDDAVVSDVDDVADAYIKSAPLLGAGIIAQKTENEGRWSLFQDFKNDIQGFEFSAMLENSCELCAELDGKTFKIDDADSVEYTPPLHPQCECIIVPILTDETAPDDWDGLDSAAELFTPDELTKMKKLREAKP